MVDHPLTLMAVLAHPDDELWMSPALAKYSDMGVRTVLVTATLGEEGQILDPDLNPDEVRERLGEIRERELREAARLIGISSLEILGYRDSGMDGTPANQDHRNFHNADAQEAVGRLVRIIRSERPHVIVTDDERGTYGHPDHLAANRTAVAAFDAAGDPSEYRELNLEAWKPQKLYYTAFARNELLHMRDALRERGIPWGDENDGEEWLNFTVPDERITTRVAIDPSHLLRMREAGRAHRTQITADDPWFSLPMEVVSEIQTAATFSRVRSLVDAPLPEDDLFAGLRVHKH